MRNLILVTLILHLFASFAYAGAFDVTPPTHEERLVSFVDAQKLDFQGQIQDMKARIKMNFDSIWYNSEFTPQEILAQYGDNGEILFLASRGYENYVKFLDPTYEYLVPPCTVTPTGDWDGVGSVTIECPEVSGE